MEKLQGPGIDGVVAKLEVRTGCAAFFSKGSAHDHVSNTSRNLILFADPSLPSTLPGMVPGTRTRGI